MIISFRLIFLLILSRLIIDFFYFNYILEIYAYEGFKGNINSYFSNFIISLSFLFPFIINNREKFNISNYLIFILIVGILIPSSSLYSFGGLSLNWYLINFGFFVFLTFSNNYLDKFEFKSFSLNNYTLFNLFLLIITFLSSALFVNKFGLKINLDLLTLDSELIANQRQLYKSVAAPAGIVGYLIANLYNIIIPVLFGISIIFKKRILMLLSIVMCLIVFSTTSARSLPFTLILLLGIILIERLISLPRQYHYLLGYFFILFIGGIIFYFIPKGSLLVIIPALIFNRIIFSPQLVSESYFNYFQDNNYTYLLDTTIGSFIGKSYYTDLPLEIGRIFFNNANANTGIISDGYAKMGIFGVFISAIILLIILKLISIISKQKNLILIKVIVTKPIFVLINGSIFTSILTNGLLISLFLITLIPHQKKE